MADEEPTDLNLTPYLDVLMNLIVFVLVSGAGLVTWGALPAQTAGASSAGVVGTPPRVRVERSGLTLSLGGGTASPVKLEELPSRLGGVGGRKLVLEAAGDVTLEQVVATMDAARKAHFDEVTLAD